MTDHGGVLAGAFEHVVFKRVSAVEADVSRSNQHEFNGTIALRRIFGDGQPRLMETDFVWMPDNADFLTEEGILTWYDARARHPVRSEYRLYYRDNAVTKKASEGDLLLIGIRPTGRLLVLLAPGSSVASRRIAWLFGIETRPGAAFASLAIRPEAVEALATLLGGDQTSLVGSGWDAEDSMEAAPDDGSVRIGEASTQRSIGIAKDDAEDWGEATTPVLPPIGGPALARTFRAVLDPARLSR